MLPKRILVLQSIFFALLGVFLLYLSFRKTNFSEIVAVIQSGNHWIILPVLLVSIWVLIARSLRWKILYNSIGENAPVNYLFAALTTGYLVNLAIPRLGELTRALVLKRALDYPLNRSLGTILFERVADLICLGLIIGVAFLLEFLNHGSLLNSFTKDIEFLSLPKLLVLLGGLVLGYILFVWLGKRKDRFSEWISNLLNTSFALIKMEQKVQFLLYTISIWIGFYLMTYLWFFMFKDSCNLSLYDAFLVMVLGVVARTLPIQAGSAGAYHFVVSQALLLLGVNLLTGNALAIVIHGFQTILTLFFGLTSYLWLLYQEKKLSNEPKFNK